MNQYKFKNLLSNAKEIIEFSQKYENSVMTQDGLKFYDQFCKDIFIDYSTDRLMSPGFKIYVLQTMSMLLAIDEFIENKQKKYENNVVYLKDYKVV